MNSPCARCKKTVYPVEKFSCLDKVWHKGCFTCEMCNLKLTMKTYKGYNKLPYCNAHYPTTRFTAVVDTPEALRLAKQQKNQSDVQYRKDKKESLKGFTPIADSIANKQATQAARLASAVGYQQPTQEMERSVRNYHPPQQQQTSYDDVYENSNSAPAPAAAPFSTPSTAVYENSNSAPAPAATPISTPSTTQPRYVALYDYIAGDDDEISFDEGDIIVDVTPIDEGWMEGRNSKGGQHGMFPSNYVQLL